MNEESLINFYWDALNKSESIISELNANEMPETAESKLVKGLAVAGLIRNNVKFHLVQPDKEVTKTKKVGFISFTSTEENQDFQNPKVILRDLNGFDHEFELDMLSQILGPDFDSLVLGKKPAGQTLKPVTEIKIADLPDDFYETEQKKEEEKPAEEETPLDNGERLPVFAKDGRYKDDIQSLKLWDSFVYNHHAVTINYKGNEGTIHFYVYPLAIKYNELATDIMVIAESGDMCRANVSRGSVSSVELSFGDIPFVIRGSFQDGKFNSIVKPLIQEVIDTMKESVYPHEAETRTSTTYVQSEYHGILFNIFPAKFKKDEFGDYYPANGTNGYTPAGVVIERDNHVEVITPTSEGTFSVLGNDNETILIETYWNCPKQGHTFNYHFDS